jgi:hypothetical protein
VFAAVLVLGSGCADSKMLKSGDTDTRSLPGTSAPLSPVTKPDISPVVQASATTPAASSTTNNAFSWFTGRSDKSKQGAIEIAVGWRNWIDYLPDPSRNGESGPGLAGQLFLFGPGLQTVEADGNLIVDLFDESPRPPGQPGNIPERWRFDKETLKKLRSVDERFGKCYVLFLPWPTYRPDVTKVRLLVRYETDGRTLIPEETKMTIGLPPSAASNTWSTETNNGAQPNSAMSLLGNSGSPAGTGLGGDSMPLGVIGTLPSGATSANRPASNLPGAATAMPITGGSFTNVPLTPQPGGAASPLTPGAFQSSTGQMPPSSSSVNGLTPIGSAPQGLQPLAFTASPLGR